MEPPPHDAPDAIGRDVGDGLEAAIAALDSMVSDDDADGASVASAMSDVSDISTSTSGSLRRPSDVLPSFDSRGNFARYERRAVTRRLEIMADDRAGLGSHPSLPIGYSQEDRQIM